MRNIIVSIFLSFFCIMFSSFTFANTVADIKTNLIQEMTKDGFVPNEKSNEAIEKYVTKDDKLTKVITPEDLKSAEKEGTWQSYLSLVNLIKLVAILLILVAFANVIKKIIMSCLVIIMAIPIIIYQLALLSLSLVFTFKPEIIWESQAFYLALVSSISNIIIVSWILTSYKQLEEFFEKLFKLGINPVLLALFYGSLYFGSYAYGYESQIFGFVTVILASFFFVVGLILLFDNIDDLKPEPAINFTLCVNIAVLIGYVFVRESEIFKNYFSYFTLGFEYFFTALISGILLSTTFPETYVRKSTSMFHVILFTALSVFSCFAYFMLDAKVIGSIVMSAYSIFLLSWLVYASFKMHFIFGTAITGATLYGIALLLEKYGEYIILYV